MVEPGAPGQVPKGQGVPKERGVPRGKGVPPDRGVPPEKGVPRSEAVLPGGPGHKLPGEPGQVPRGAPGQLDKNADNPWAPTPDTIPGEQDLVLPPSAPERDDDAPAEAPDPAAGGDDESPPR